MSESFASSPWAPRLRAIGAGLAVAALALVAAVGQVAETRGARAAPALAQLGPGKLGQLRALELDAQGRAPRGIAAAGRRALPANPLAFEPFFAVAAESFRDVRTSGSPRDAELLREALRRNPRSREARLLLMRHAVGTGNLREAIDQLAVLNRLNNTLVSQLMVALGQALRSERQVDEAVAALGSHRELYLPFVRGFVQANKPPALVRRLVADLPAAALEDASVRQLAINQLVTSGAYDQARALWGNRRGVPGRAVYSPNFTETKAPPPFNWLLSEDSTGVAERTSGGGLMVQYYGRESGRLASQLLTLSPGAYRVVIDYSGESGKPGAMALQVQCEGAPAVLTRALLDAAAGVNLKRSLTFSVPAQGCTGQSLAVVGLPLEGRAGQTIVVRSLDVVGANSQ